MDSFTHIILPLILFFGYSQLNVKFTLFHPCQSSVDYNNIVSDDSRWDLPKDLLQFWRLVTCFVVQTFHFVLLFYPPSRMSLFQFTHFLIPQDKRNTLVWFSTQFDQLKFGPLYQLAAILFSCKLDSFSQNDFLNMVFWGHYAQISSTILSFHYPFNL